jgi:hypothetical protein
MPIWAGVFSLTGLLKIIMKKVIFPLTVYNNTPQIHTSGVALNLLRKITVVSTVAATVTLPSTKSRRKEFTVIAAGVAAIITCPATNGTMTYGTSVGTNSSLVLASGSVATFRAVNRVWYRVS